ncbi:uncharacterized protein LOC125654645 [Ostrea edulis]|uniref:uncharacterized protein LOC125654645 n=1 Tax=Ostrea edulis TaxID=37623 RepID=UPI0020944D51|nr:uncharacterized protein LOC125654645 [Ostrea edulis]
MVITLIFISVPGLDGESPYFFGTSDLACVTTKGRFHLIVKRSVQMNSERNRTRRAAQTRHVFSPTHRWIYYKGMFYEWGTDGGTKTRLFGFLNDAKSYSIKTGLPYKGETCDWLMESMPAGYSSVSVECLMGCTANYWTVSGDYNILQNNCHHFANTISNILCSNICPEWCFNIL